MVKDKRPIEVPNSSWRVVDASVRVSLAPAELGARARHVAARKAFAGLLMRYNTSLGGVVVAQRGGLRFPSPAYAAIAPASPFAHVVAKSTLLVFAPPPKTVMVAEVVHVGPDHVGMALWDTFHVVLSRAETAQRFEYKSRPRMWRWKAHDHPGNENTVSHTGTRKGGERNEDELQMERSAPSKNIVMGANIRFSVVALRHTVDGLYHIEATLLNADGEYSASLGVISSRNGFQSVDEDGQSCRVSKNPALDDRNDPESLLSPIGPILKSRRSSVTPSHIDAIGFNDPLAMYLEQDMKPETTTDSAFDNEKPLSRKEHAQSTPESTGPRRISEYSGDSMRKEKRAEKRQRRSSHDTPSVHRKDKPKKEKSSKKRKINPSS